MSGDGRIGETSQSHRVYRPARCSLGATGRGVRRPRSHAYHPLDSWSYSAPVIFAWIEGRVIITDVASEGGNGLQPGDLVLAIDGLPAAEALAEKEGLVSGATPQWRHYQALFRLRLGAFYSELKLDVLSRAGETRSVVLRRTIDSQNMREARPPTMNEIKPGIFYLDLDRITDEDFQSALPQLEKAKGIIFDLRGYPRVSPVIISHLIDSPVQSARWLVPIVTVPNHQPPLDYDTSGRWTLRPIAPRLKGKLIFLTDGRAISAAESYLGIVEAYKLAQIVGEPTAGTNGNVNPFSLPGNYSVSWTGMKVLKNDGSQHHGIGIQPTVPVSRTIRGVTERRDEQLERAVALVSQESGSTIIIRHLWAGSGPRAQLCGFAALTMRSQSRSVSLSKTNASR
jgi:C-terminal processing protease CtpA/Prc